MFLCIWLSNAEHLFFPYILGLYRLDKVIEKKAERRKRKKGLECLSRADKLIISKKKKERLVDIKEDFSILFFPIEEEV